MRLEQLIYFVEAVELGSIGKASEKLYVSHQNISKSIKQLEDELELNLLKRTKTGVFLTPVGMPIYNHAKDILHSVEAIKQSAKSPGYKQTIDATIQGNLKLLATPAFSAVIIGTIKKCNLLYPNISIQYTLLEPAHLLDAAQNQPNADLFFMSVNDAFDLNKLDGQYYLLKRDTLKLLVKQGNPLADYTQISMKKLAETPLAVYQTSYQNKPLYLELLNQNGYKIKRSDSANMVYLSNSTEVIQDYLYSGVVASVTTELTTRRPANMPKGSCVAKPLNPKIPINHYLYIPNATKRTNVFRVFCNLFQEECQKK